MGRRLRLGLLQRRPRVVGPAALPAGRGYRRSARRVTVTIGSTNSPLAVSGRVCRKSLMSAPSPGPAWSAAGSVWLPTHASLLARMPLVVGGPGGLDLGKVGVRPCDELTDGVKERSPHRRERVLDPWRDDRVDGPVTMPSR